MALYPASLLLGPAFMLLPALLFSQALFRFPSPRFYFFLGYVGFTILVAAVYCCIAHPLFRLIGRRDLAQYTTARFWWYITAPIVGIKLKIEGEELLRGWGGSSLKGPCVFVANHQSELDILLYLRVHQSILGHEYQKS
jgi:1-acyl-sn-glycerol-3-phosphate acyltransferase